VTVAVRVGVDVGGTFTKAVACDARTGRVVCRAVVPTTHDAPGGVAEGVVLALRAVVSEVERVGAGPVALVAHSTTQAVNALLEGDVAPVGIVGIGRAPDLRRAERRTRIGDVRLAPGRALRTLHAFLDATRFLSPDASAAAVADLAARGARAIVASEAYGVEDPRGERLVLAAAERLGLPACAGHELAGVYGLELRTVTAALNASILPIALRTAEVVERAVAALDGAPPLLVMRGDGGAAGVATMRRRPLATAFSGPAASVAGALRHLRVRDAVVVEVGGTSTNVSVVAGGRPVLSYVRVLEHTTAVRSLDVRVTGVAGGSMLRIGRRLGRGRVVGVGPRSAHIAGLDYCSFADPAELADARALLVAPREGDPPDHAVVETSSGRRLALTLTCAANALGRVPEGAYARGDAAAARAGFAALARLLGGDPTRLAAEALERAARAAAAVVADAIASARLDRPEIVGVGGGAGALVPAVAELLGLPWRIPEDAEVVSSIGDALSLVRVEIERSVARATAETVARVAREAEEAAVAAGADPATVEVETEAVPDRGAIRAVALASAAAGGAAEGGAGSEGERLPEDLLAAVARDALGAEPEHLADTSGYCVFRARAGRGDRFLVLDRRGAVAARGEGVALAGPGAEVARRLSAELARRTRHLGPFAVAPAVRIVRGRRLVDLSMLSSPAEAERAALAECALADGETLVALVEAGR
jgi:N-methylhydantoinase A